jgi:hypothetical protein
MRRALLTAALLLAVATAQTAAAQSSRKLDEVQRVDRLGEQVRQAEAIRAIKRLQAAYGHYAEFGLWNDFAELFADQGVGHYAQGPMVGRDAIRKLFFEQVGQSRLGLADGRIYPHIVFQPVVTLDPGGRTARGRWRVLALLGGYGGNATWVGGVYENRYVFENGAWKIAELTYATQFTAPYDRGWTERRAPTQSAPPSDPCNDYLAGDCTFAPHFDPRRAGTPSPPPVVNPEADARPADAAPTDLAARVADLERRAARLADEAAVTNLQHAYGYYVDRKRWDDVADLFAASATLELGNQGVYVGQPSIRRALEQFGPQGLKPGELNDHLQLQTLVTVAPDGGTAQARGVELAQWGGVRDGAYRAEWRESIFENRYVNEGGIWKIAAVHLYPRFITDYAQGWAKSAEPAPPSSKEFPPDRPPTAEYAVYPKFSIPPLHFVNPATGAPPQYPDDQRPPASSAPSQAAAPPRAPARGGGSLADRLAAAERAAAVAVAYDAAENLLNAHSYYLDEMRWDDVADLFAADGWDEVAQLGVYAGRERIRAALRALHPRDGRPAGVLAIRQTTQPVIDVAPDGASAKIRERVLQVGGRAGAEGEWLAGVYEGEAVLEDGAWKLAGLDLDYTWAAPYHGGWAAVAAAGHFEADPGVGSDPGIGAVAQAPAAGAPAAFTPPSGLPAPDRALRGPVRPPFPEILRLPFHYANPVSGRPPR